jgi:uridine kinase
LLATNLILIEGLPGSGKSTTTSRLGKLLQDSGISCDWYLEDDHPHPIPCLDFEIKGLAQKNGPSLA